MVGQYIIINLLNQQKGDFIMSKKNINVTYWTQSTGVTGQCLSERGQKLFDTTSALYNQATGEKLSKMKFYDIVLTECRETKSLMVSILETYLLQVSW